MRTKSEVRSYIKQRLSLVDGEFAEAIGQDLPDMLMGLDEFKEALDRSRRIALYRAIEGEIPMDYLALSLLKMGKKVCFPKVCGDRMEFFDVSDLSDSSFLEGRYGIKEPKDTSDPVTDLIDMVLVPGLAYNEEGTRLGRGGGYYDRFLASGNMYTVAVCYDFQIDSDIPVEDHDITVDLLLPVMTSDDEEE